MTDRFATVADPSAPVRVVLVGAGGMGRTWIHELVRNGEVDLVGIVDLDARVADAAVAGAGLSDITIGTAVSAVAEQTGAHAIVNATVPAAHHPVTTEALFSGLPVLSEKPIAPTVAQALSLAGAAEASGQLLMTSQSRRYSAAMAAYRDQVRALGDLGVATTQFFLAPHFGGFREEMDHVLLVDMAIHAFDAARYLLDREPVSVYCEESDPVWSWFRSGAAATAVFEFSGGLRYAYTGSWVADGLETSWNGAWRINGAGGTAVWDGDGAPEVQRAGEDATSVAALREAPEGVAGSLVGFIDALRTGIAPSGEVHENVLSLAMVEAAIRSAEDGTRMLIADVLEDAYRAAVADETRDDVRAALVDWGSAAGGLAGVQTRSP